jgi:hypothetical protein
MTQVLVNHVLYDNKRDVGSISVQEANQFMPYVNILFEQLTFQNIVALNISISNSPIELRIVISREEIDEQHGRPYSTLFEHIKNLADQNQGIEVTCFHDEVFENPKSVEEVKKKSGINNSKQLNIKKNSLLFIRVHVLKLKSRIVCIFQLICDIK